MTYVIIPAPTCPRYVPTRGWRRLAEKLRLRTRRTMIFAGDNYTLYCAPESVETLTRYLRSRNIQYVIGQPRARTGTETVKPANRLHLHAVPNPPSTPRGDVH